MEFNRIWAMPTSDTFDCKPIGNLVKRYLAESKVSVDPFARNNRWATYTNDLNPDTKADSHLKAVEFLAILKGEKVEADLIIFDPPYSARQAKECYESFGDKMFTQEDSQNVGRWGDEKKRCYDLLTPGGYFMHFGWHTNGIGEKYHSKIREILLVCHGSAHNDTICLVEQKMAHQFRLETNQQGEL